MLALHLKMSHGRTLFPKLVSLASVRIPGANLFRIKSLIGITTLLSDYMKWV